MPSRIPLLLGALVLGTVFLSLPATAQTNDPPIIEDTSLLAQSNTPSNDLLTLQEAATTASEIAEVAAFEADLAAQAQAETAAEAEEFATKAENALAAEEEAIAAARTAETAATEAENSADAKVFATKAEEALAALIAATAASELASELKVTAEIFAREAKKHSDIAIAKAEIATAARDTALAAAEALENAKAIAAAEIGAIEATESEEIELRSRDGLVSVKGILTDFDADLVTLETSYGVVGIEREGIECFGAKCPSELVAGR